MSIVYQQEMLKALLQQYRNSDVATTEVGDLAEFLEWSPRRTLEVAIQLQEQGRVTVVRNYHMIARSQVTLVQHVRPVEDKPVLPNLSVNVEPAMEHVRNALQTLSTLEPFEGITDAETLAVELTSVKARLEQALVAMAAGNIGK